MSTPTQTPPQRGPRRGDIVSAAAGRLGMASRYGATDEQIAALRRALEAAKLEKHVLEAGPLLSAPQVRGLITTLRGFLPSGR